MKLIYSDEQLVKLFVHDCKGIYFGELYQRYYQKLVRYCLTIIKDENAAEDLTQDIFVRLLKRLASFDGRGKFSTWLYTLARNYCIDYLRSAKMQENALQQFTIESDRPETFLDLANDFMAAENTSHLLQLSLLKLPDKEKQLLTQKYVLGCSIDEIAQLAGANAATVKVRLMRARNKLRDVYLSFEVNQ